MPFISIKELQLIPRTPGYRKPRPRSAGASNRPMRSENISELVRFFQASEEVLGDATAKHDGAMDLIKAGQRRLRQFGYAKPEKRAADTASSAAPSSEKLKATHRQLVALQREGLLPASASVDDILDMSRPSRTKRDVEAMGRPWLDDTMSSRTRGDSSTVDSRQQRHLRCESLGLGDLAALVEFSVSFPEYDDEPGPPPYQQTQSPAGDHQGQNVNVNDDSQPALGPGPASRNNSTVAESGDRAPGPSPTLERTARPQPSSSGRPRRQSPETIGNSNNKLRDGSHDSHDDANSLEVLLRATEQIEREKNASRSLKPTRTTEQDAPTRPHLLNQGVTDTPFSFKTPVKNRPGVSYDDRGSQEDTRTHGAVLRNTVYASPTKNLNAEPIPLKLVAECLPARTSSRAIIPKAGSPQISLDSVVLSTNSNDPAASSRQLRSVHTPTADNFPRPQTLLSPFPIQTRRARSVTPNGQPGLKKRRTKERGSPLYTVSDIAPPPPPTKPLPSLPEANNSQALNPAPRPLSLAGNRAQIPDSTMCAAKTSSEGLSNKQGDDSPTLGAPVHQPKLRKHLRLRPSSRATMLSSDDADRAATPVEDHSLRRVSSADPGFDALEQSRRGREERVRALRLRDLSDVTARKDDNMMDRFASTLEPSTSSQVGNRAMHSQVLARKLSRGKQHRVSAAPRIPLPSDPPFAAHHTPTRRRRAGSASSLPMSSDVRDGGLSRNISIRSTSGTSPGIRRGRDVRTAVATPNGNGRRRSESPSLPSSDDEGHGTTRARSPEVPSHAVLDGPHHGQRAPSQQPQQSHAPDMSRSTSRSITTFGAASQGQLSPRSLNSQRTSYSHDSQLSQLRSMRMLEARVAMLERQNKMLQAALLAALDIGVSHDVERSSSASPALDSVITMSQNNNERLGTALNGLGIDEPQYDRRKTSHTARPDSWASGHDDTSRGSFETTASRSDNSVRVLENMLNDFDVDVA